MTIRRPLEFIPEEFHTWAYDILVKMNGKLIQEQKDVDLLGSELSKAFNEGSVHDWWARRFK